VTQKNRVFGTSLVGGYGVEIKIEADITVLVTYRRSQGAIGQIGWNISRTRKKCRYFFAVSDLLFNFAPWN